jgi:hypothetical protein
MSVNSVGGPPPIKTPEAAEPKGPELTNDHDGDDAGAARTPAAPPPGQGTMLDKKA